MIYDTLANLSLYAQAIPHYAVLRDFLATPFASLPDGCVEIDGDRVFATLSTYGMKRQEDAVFEAHRRYADVQIVLSGEEHCGIVPGATWLKETAPYDPARDIVFFASPASYSKIVLGTGAFAYFGVSDAHMPGIAPGALGRIRKCVVKLLLP